MADTGARTLRLLSLLQARRYWAGAALADRLGVSERTVRRDVERLRQLGYPVQARPGVEGGYQLASGRRCRRWCWTTTKPRPSPSACSPPCTARSRGRRGLGPGVGQAGPGDARTPAAPCGCPALDRGSRAVVPGWRNRRCRNPRRRCAAARDVERLEIGYRTAGGEAAERRVEPHRLVALGQRWYLVATTNWRSDWRTFRVDRIESQGHGSPVRPRPIPTGDRWLSSGPGSPAPRTYQVWRRCRPLRRTCVQGRRWCAVENARPPRALSGSTPNRWSGRRPHS